MNRKILSLLLILSLVLCLSACGEPKLTSADLAGAWSASADVSDEISGSFSQDELSEAFGSDISAFLNVEDLKVPPLTLNMLLNEDGTFVVEADDSCKNVIAVAVADWFKGADMDGLSTALMTMACEQYGYTLEDLLEITGLEDASALAEEVLGMSMADYMSDLGDSLSEELDEKFDLSEFASEGTWEFKTDKVVLTIDGSHEELTFDKDAFTLTEKAPGYSCDEVVFSKK